MEHSGNKHKFIKGIGLVAFQFAMALSVLLNLQRCANPVSPTGGPRDEDPPVLLKAVPPVYTTNFAEDQIRLTFDEFIELKNINQQLIISPPMETMPDFRIRGKTLLIDLSDDLKENTTYTIYFGNAITDLTENNPQRDFQYVFATGDVLDSLTLRGTIAGAYDNNPSKGINIMLYIDNNDTIPLDSLPYLVKPYFMTRSDDNGNFVLKNLPDHPFLIFALEDLNNSLTYDQPNESIAFHDTLVRPYYIKVPGKVFHENDTIESLEADVPEETHEALKLFLFQEKDTVQRFIRASMIKNNQLSFVFKTSTREPEINPLNIAGDPEWFLLEANKDRDTLTFWLKHIPADTVLFEIRDAGMVPDTVLVRLQQKSISSRKRTDDPVDTDQAKDPIKMSFTRGAPELNLPFLISFEYPVVEYDLSKILLIESEDTLKADFAFKDLVYRRAAIAHDWKESTTYQIIIPDSTFHDLTGRSNDTIIRRFATKTLAEYGHLFVDITLTNPGINHIFQLLQRGQVVREFQLKEDGRIRFDYLIPGNYQLKAIYDKNNNGEWDTGNYRIKQQPERVIFFPGETNIRANWDVVESWEL
jgi:hypothetical protein